MRKSRKVMTEHWLGERIERKNNDAISMAEIREEIAGFEKWIAEKYPYADAALVRQVTHRLGLAIDDLGGEFNPVYAVMLITETLERSLRKVVYAREMTTEMWKAVAAVKANDVKLFAERRGKKWIKSAVMEAGGFRFLNNQDFGRILYEAKVEWCLNAFVCEWRLKNAY